MQCNNWLFWQAIHYPSWHCMELESCFLRKKQTKGHTQGSSAQKFRFFITVAIGPTIKIKLAQLTLHAPPAIIKDCKQMPKRLHFIFRGTYGVVFDLNFLYPVKGMLYCRALSLSLWWCLRCREGPCSPITWSKACRLQQAVSKQFNQFESKGYI